MTFEMAAAALVAPSSAGAAAAVPVQAGYGVSLTDFGGFQDALARAGMRLEARPINPPSEAARQLMKPFDHINSEAARLATDAQASKATGHDLSPGEMVSLTVRCQEFMFHCQLTSNIANRTSEGLQTLFRQQA